jgi:hypothetical protein
MHIQIRRYTYILLCILTTLHTQAQVADDKYNFGLKLGLGYTMLGAFYDSYDGAVMPNFSAFFSRKLGQSIDLVGDFGYTGTRFGQRSSDSRFNASYLDGSLLAYIYPSYDSRDFAFVAGYKTHFLMSHNSQVFAIGNYLRVNDPRNLNQDGTIASAALLGFSIALSPIVNIELNYQHSFDDRNTPSRILGRPAIIETAIRLNASGIRYQFANKTSRNSIIINQMKQGAALVMLTTPSSKEIQNLRETNREAEVMWIENEIAIRNANIMKAFQQHFDFSKVYFFYDSNAYKVMSRDMKGIFIDQSLKPNAMIELNDTLNYYIISFCEDISDYTSKSQFGLYVYDGSLTQFPRPFNSPSQLISPVLEGDPLNYLKKRRYNFSTLPFDRYVIRLNAKFNRMLLD